MISLLIPTLNRSSFVIRYLHYLRDTNFRGSVCIGDSSDPWHIDQTKRAIRNLRSDFAVIHRPFPGLKITECIREMLPLISTPFAMYICDDDLLVAKTLEQCVQFLNNNPDFSAVSGIVIHCRIRAEGTINKIEGIAEGPLYEMESDSARQRLLDLFTNYNVVAYSLARTGQFKERWPLDSSFSDASFSAEMLPCGMLVAQGKCKKLDRLFVVRQIHEQRYLMPDIFDWLTSPQWLYSYKIFADRLADELAKQDNVPIAEAREVIKQAFWSYLANGMMRKWQGHYAQNGSGLYSELRGLARRIPGLRSTWQKVCSFLPGEDNKMSLEALLRPSSPYHDDFMPIYRAITTPVPELNELRPE